MRLVLVYITLTRWDCGWFTGHKLGSSLDRIDRKAGRVVHIKLTDDTIRNSERVKLKQRAWGPFMRNLSVRALV